MIAANVALLTLGAVGGAFALTLALTPVAWRFARRAGYVDDPRTSEHKSHARVTPYGGGVALFVGAWGPLLIVTTIASLMSVEAQVAALNVVGEVGETLAPYLAGFALRIQSAWVILLGGALFHLVGLWDDRHPLGALTKLLLMFAIAVGVCTLGDVRIIYGAGPVVSITVSVLWLVILINAFNFLDNMDGLSAGVAAICLSLLVSCGLIAEQRFVPTLSCVFLGSALGFLVWNLPPARVFLGDAGSLVVGYMVGVSSMMTTYFRQSQAGAESTWSVALAMPLAILAVPLYDAATVVILRVRAGRSPLVGDQRHFSHRLLARGMSRLTALLTIYLATLATGLAALLLRDAAAFEALIVLGIVCTILALIALLEFGPRDA